MIYRSSAGGARLHPYQPAAAPGRACRRLRVAKADRQCTIETRRSRRQSVIRMGLQRPAAAQSVPLNVIAVTLCVLALVSPGSSRWPRPNATAPRGGGEFDIVVYGGTPGGIMAAIAARQTVAVTTDTTNRRRTGSVVSAPTPSVVLIANGTLVGGFTAGGHCGNDMYQDWVFGGLAREFWTGMHNHYGNNNPNKDRPECIGPNSTGG